MNLLAAAQNGNVNAGIYLDPHAPPTLLPLLLVPLAVALFFVYRALRTEKD